MGNQEGGFHMKEKLLAQARGDERADLVFKNGKVADVFNGELIEDRVAVSRGTILGIGDYRGKEEVDLEGGILVPGFFDGHLHVESSLVSVGEFARRVIPLGTTSLYADPHEIANVAGKEGIQYMLEEGRLYPWNFNLMLPSCVPASPFETPGAVLEMEELLEFKGKESVYGLGEVMNYPGVINGDEKIWAKLNAFSGIFKDGHAPGVTGMELNAYLLGDIRADHEVLTREEARKKVAAGMYVMVREASGAHNLRETLRALDAKNRDRFILSTDDRHPEDLLRQGHINYLLQLAVKEGLDPLLALRLATLNPACAFGARDLGAIAPGYRADLVVLKDLERFQARKVYKDGRLVAKDGNALFPVHKSSGDDKIRNSVKIAPLGEGVFKLPSGKRFRVIEMVPGQITTRHLIKALEVKEGQIANILEEGLVKLSVVERHHASGNIGLGLLAGLGLRKGALAASVAHDSHHIIVAGVDDFSMLMAVREIEKMGGGIVLVADGQVKASVPLPIAGLMSDEPIAEVARRMERLNQEAEEMGIVVENPTMALSFLALPVIPELKLTDRGLFDSLNFQPVELVVD